MKKVRIELFTHRGQQWLSVHFPYNASLNKLLRGIPEVSFSQTRRCWYFTICSQKLGELRNQLLAQGLQADISAEVRKAVVGNFTSWQQKMPASGQDINPALLNEFSKDNCSLIYLRPLRQGADELVGLFFQRNEKLSISLSRMKDLLSYSHQHRFKKAKETIQSPLDRLDLNNKNHKLPPKSNEDYLR